jgi:3-(methylthio)propanoyl-CoA dehydrogenase
MLATMRALTEASRALAYVAAAQSDLAHRHPDEALRAAAQARYEYLVPIVKGWSTELSIDVTSLGVQVHGGMGFIEETGAAQFYRDARILPIYEGTTAIQANDLIGRKTLRDGGVAAQALIADIAKTVEALGAHDGAPFRSMKLRLAQGQAAFSSAVAYVLANAKTDPNAVFAGSVPYLKLAGIVLGGWQMARAMLASARLMQDDAKFHGAKIATAQFYAEHVLPQAVALEAAIVVAKGGEGVLALSEDQF